MKTSDCAELKACIEPHFSLSDEMFAQLSAEATVVRVAASDILHHQNEHPASIYFLSSGLLYAYFETSEGKLFCKEMYWDHDLVFCFRSLIRNVPLRYALKAIEPSKLFAVPVKRYRELVQEHSELQRFHTAVVSEYYMYKEDKEAFLLLHTPEQQVALFFEYYPELVGRVPQHVIASYLGITPISFSRIKQRLK